MSRPTPDAPSERWFPLARPRPDARLRLFVLPYAGGRASAFRGWQAGLPAEVQVLALQPPGREQRIREVPFQSVAEAVPAVVDAIAPLLDRPYALYGHSLGALVAYESLRALRSRGAPPPVRFFASGSRAPHRPLLAAPVAHLGPEALLARLGTLGGTPQAVLECRELMELFLPMLTADFRMSETYLAREPAPIDAPITAFGGEDDAEVDRPRVEAWRDVAAGGFEVRWFAGGHFFVHEREDAVLAAVARALEPALG